MHLYGASGHAKVIIDILKSQGQTIGYIYDDNFDISKLLGYEVSTPDKLNELDDDEMFIISIGNNEIRSKLACALDVKFGNAIHDRSIVADSVKLGLGVVIMAGVVVNADARIGNHVILNTMCSVDHDCSIADFVHIGPKATLCGNVKVGEGSLIGAGSVIAPNLTIGKNCTIGTGAVITKNVPDDTTIIKFNERI